MGRTWWGRQEMRAEFWWKNILVSSHLHIRVGDGTVTLRGILTKKDCEVYGTFQNRA